MRRSLLCTAALLGLAVSAHAQTVAQTPAMPAATQAPVATAPAPAATPGPATPAPTGAMPATPAAKPMPKRMPHPVNRHPMHGAVRPAAKPAAGQMQEGYNAPSGNEPTSSSASNITAGDSKSVIAPRLPTPAGGQDASINTFLSDASRALNARQTGRAQEALERAETAMLQRSVNPDAALTPSQQPDVMQVAKARDALSHRNIPAAKQAIAAAMAH